jgi:hypothetical protein
MSLSACHARVSEVLRWCAVVPARTRHVSFLTKRGNIVWSAFTGTILVSGKFQLPSQVGSRSGHPACVGIN